MGRPAARVAPAARDDSASRSRPRRPGPGPIPRPPTPDARSLAAAARPQPAADLTRGTRLRDADRGGRLRRPVARSTARCWRALATLVARARADPARASSSRSRPRRSRSRSWSSTRRWRRWLRRRSSRSAADGRRPRGRRLRYAVGELLSCTRCIGAWSALGLVALRTARARRRAHGHHRAGGLGGQRLPAVGFTLLCSRANAARRARTRRSGYAASSGSARPRRVRDAQQRRRARERQQPRDRGVGAASTSPPSAGAQRQRRHAAARAASRSP